MKAKLFLLLITGFWAIAPLTASDDKLTNEGVEALFEAGLSQELIVSHIEASNCDFDLSVSELVRLATEVNLPGSDDSEVFEVGAYHVSETGPRKIQAHPVDIMAGGSSRRSWRRSLLTGIPWGVNRSQTFAVIKGARSDFTIEERRPELLVKLADDQIITGYSLARLIEEKSERRYVFVTVGGGLFNTEVRGGFDPEQLVPFTYEQVERSLYRIVPENDLEPGEYALIGMFISGRVYDFSVR